MSHMWRHPGVSSIQMCALMSYLRGGESVLFPFSAGCHQRTGAAGSLHMVSKKWSWCPPPHRCLSVSGCSPSPVCSLPASNSASSLQHRGRVPILFTDLFTPSHILIYEQYPPSLDTISVFSELFYRLKFYPYNNICKKYHFYATFYGP